MSDTRPKPFVFVLMPFEPAFRDIYELGIRAAASEAGAYAERVDEQIFDESILQRVYNQIAKADLIVADMTGRNANVFYEVGYAHALGKRTILLTREAADIPFDLKHFPHIVHGGSIADLKNELQRRIRWFAENPTTTFQTPLELAFFTEGRPITNGSALAFLLPRQEDTSDINIAFDVHNPTDRIIDGARAEIGLVVPEALRRAYAPNVSTVRVDTSRWMHVFTGLGAILPGAWRALRMRCQRRYLDREHGRELSVILRLFAEVGYRDTQFTIRFENRQDEAIVLDGNDQANAKTGTA